jgi:5-carboxymethyl-2-hydroxymuconic-semialdehyde dehydrogenase
VRADQPVERALHDRDLEGGARLAFGNTAVLKMSELSPMTAARLGELALEAGIPAGVLNVVHGFGKEAGEPLCAHPDVRAISFTGSTATGNRIVKAAGLKKFSMELGGKSPFVIFDDADLDRALDAAIFMIFSNNGERCTAGSRILVQQSIYADFAAKFAERAKRIVVGDPLDEKTTIGPMISQGHLAKVRSYIELGPKEGATLLCGGWTGRRMRPSCRRMCRRATTSGPRCLPTWTTA